MITYDDEDKFLMFEILIVFFTALCIGILGFCLLNIYDILIAGEIFFLIVFIVVPFIAYVVFHIFFSNRIKEKKDIGVGICVKNNPYSKYRYFYFANENDSVKPRQFLGCEQLVYIKLPDNLEKIKNSTFAGCKSLESIEIPESVTEIEEFSFLGCSSLKSIIIPENVEKIGKNAFAYCENLKEVTIQNYNKKIELEHNIFSGTFGTLFAFQKLNKNSLSDVFYNCKDMKFILGYGWTNIEKEKFKELKELKSIEIPKTVVRIEKNAFEKCKKLKEIIYRERAEVWKNVYQDFKTDLQPDCIIKCDDIERKVSEW